MEMDAMEEQKMPQKPEAQQPQQQTEMKTSHSMKEAAEDLPSKGQQQPASPAPALEVPKASEVPLVDMLAEPKPEAQLPQQQPQQLQI